MENNLNCRKCGSITKKSKAFINIHNRHLSFVRGEKEFEIKLIECNKCIKCGHSFC